MAEPTTVQIFSLSTCYHCKALQKLLDKYNVPYESVDVDLLEGEDREKIMDQIKVLNPAGTFPTTIIGDRVVGGHQPRKIMDILRSQKILKMSPLQKLFSKIIGET